MELIRHGELHCCNLTINLIGGLKARYHGFRLLQLTRSKLFRCNCRMMRRNSRCIDTWTECLCNRLCCRCSSFCYIRIEVFCFARRNFITFTGFERHIGVVHIEVEIVFIKVSASIFSGYFIQAILVIDITRFDVFERILKGFFTVMNGRNCIEFLHNLVLTHLQTANVFNDFLKYT